MNMRSSSDTQVSDVLKLTGHVVCGCQSEAEMSAINAYKPDCLKGDWMNK